jgi:nitrogen-specific signal transduction histidine kinase
LTAREVGSRLRSKEDIVTSFGSEETGIGCCHLGEQPERGRYATDHGLNVLHAGPASLRHVKEKMFNPFFTTKPAGEGTGLGLSMTHDIVVKQHGGKIDVQTEPGVFTEFIITLPRNGAAQTPPGGKP